MASRSHLYQAYRERSQRLLVSSLLWNLPRVHPQVGEIFELIWHRYSMLRHMVIPIELKVIQ